LTERRLAVHARKPSYESLKAGEESCQVVICTRHLGIPLWPATRAKVDPLGSVDFTLKRERKIEVRSKAVDRIGQELVWHSDALVRSGIDDVGVDDVIRRLLARPAKRMRVAESRPHAQLGAVHVDEVTDERVGPTLLLASLLDVISQHHGIDALIAPRSEEQPPPTPDRIGEMPSLTEQAPFDVSRDRGV
jgi:hypothetical protein